MHSVQPPFIDSGITFNFMKMHITEIENIPPLLFVSGIDTDAGKSFATGWLAKQLYLMGKNVITQKFVQTGNRGVSEDIMVHRKIMETGILPEDEAGLTAPVIFSYPASPDLAARIDGKVLDINIISKATEQLRKRFDYILIEGAGGLMVPLKGEYLTIDYISEHNLPVVLVTNGALGSVSHTLLSLYAIKKMGISLFALIYNPHFDSDTTIAYDTRTYIQHWIEKEFPGTYYIEMPDFAD